MRQPVSAAIRTSRSCQIFPWSSASAKPAEKMTAALVPRLAALSTASQNDLIAFLNSL